MRLDVYKIESYAKYSKNLYLLLLIDILFNGSWSLIGPFFAVFITNQIKGGDIFLLGLASLIFWIFKSLSSPIIGFICDRIHGIQDEVKFLKIGIILNSLSLLGYFFSYLPWHILFLEIIHGIGVSLYSPPRLSLLIHSLKKDRGGFYFGLNESLVGILIGLSIFLGSAIIKFFGFKTVFLIAFFICFSNLILISSLKLKDNS
jgi:predicted MFS family arabinose efflux permease